MEGALDQSCSKGEVQVQVHGVEFVKVVSTSSGHRLETFCLGDFVFGGNRFSRIFISDGVEPCHAKRFPYV